MIYGETQSKRGPFEAFTIRFDAKPEASEQK